MVYNEHQVAMRIVERRKQKCLSQEEFANKLHISISTLWRLESGNQQIMLERAVKAANILSCTVNDFVRDFIDRQTSDCSDRFTFMLKNCNDEEKDFLYEAMCSLLNAYRNSRS